MYLELGADELALLEWARLLDPNHLRALVMTAAWLLDDQQRV